MQSGSETFFVSRIFSVESAPSFRYNGRVGYISRFCVTFNLTPTEHTQVFIRKRVGLRAAHSDFGQIRGFSHEQTPLSEPKRLCSFSPQHTAHFKAAQPGDDFLSPGHACRMAACSGFSAASVACGAGRQSGDQSICTGCARHRADSENGFGAGRIYAATHF